MKKGIDVSYAQGLLDWSKINTDFVIIKCSTGVNYPDKYLYMNANGAYNRCIPLTYYHWATLKTYDVVSDARAEAKEFIGRLAELPPYNREFLAPILDFEEKNVLKFPPQLMQMWVLTFYSELKKAGHEMWLYSYAPYLNVNLPSDHILGHIPLWIAGYPWDRRSNVGPNNEVLGYANVPNIPNGPGEVPDGWTRDMVKCWQYTGQGKHEGIDGHVDLNVLYEC